jgi:hypothetical protein
VLAMSAIACGGPPKGAVPVLSGPDASAPSAAAPADVAGTAPTSSAAAPAGNASADTAASPPDAGPSAPASPFAQNAEEATSFIDDAITSRSNALVACVSDARTRRKDAHAKIVVEVGIDQEGHLLGVKLPKGAKADKALVDCFLAALRGAPFPRSHAGVITVRRTFEDKAVYR